MTREELDALLDVLEAVGFKTVDMGTERFIKDNADEDYECFEDYMNALKMKKHLLLSKVEFNKAADRVIHLITSDLNLHDIFLLAKFTSALRYVLFDMDDKTEKEEK